MYRQTRPKLGLGLGLGLVSGLGLEFAHGRACASLLIFFIHTAGRVCITSAI